LAFVVQALGKMVYNEKSLNAGFIDGDCEGVRYGR
jgi:hypothetical protein